MATVLVNGSILAKRGVFAAFRKYLNERFANEPNWTNRTAGMHQETRGYGDYVFFQDRGYFDEALWRAMQGRDFPGFDHTKWLP